MNFLMETERLILRSITEQDVSSLFLLDSEEAVFRYVPGQALQQPEETLAIIRNIRGQYERNNTGRLAVELKSSGEVIGWCGIKFVDDQHTNNRTNYYDLGYRFRTAFWGMGYASEAATPCIGFAFEQLQIPELHATVMQENYASANVLLKKGFRLCDTFLEDGDPWCWYTLHREHHTPQH
jgi:[ribosomal protein S5]-alanine N-acetyltransferase